MQLGFAGFGSGFTGFGLGFTGFALGFGGFKRNPGTRKAPADLYLPGSFRRKTFAF